MANSKLQRWRAGVVVFLDNFCQEFHGNWVTPAKYLGFVDATFANGKFSHPEFSARPAQNVPWPSSAGRQGARSKKPGAWSWPHVEVQRGPKKEMSLILNHSVSQTLPRSTKLTVAVLHTRSSRSRVVKLWLARNCLMNVLVMGIAPWHTVTQDLCHNRRNNTLVPS